MTTEKRLITVSVMEGAYSSRDVGTGPNRKEHSSIVDQCFTILLKKAGKNSPDFL